MRSAFAVPALVKASAVVIAMILTGTVAQAQQRNLRGIVTDTAGRPLQNAEVRIMDLGRVTRTDSAGNFAITRISSRIVDLTVRRLGYKVRFLRVSLINGEGDSVRVELTSEGVVLATMEVEAPEAVHPNFVGFEMRRSRGLGTFLTKADIDRLNTSYPSDAFRSLPGMQIIRVGSGSGVRFTSTQAMRTARGACQPTIWVDGQAAPGLEIDDIRAGDIHGIEIYRGASTTPAQFAASGVTHCGAIVVWTRRKK